MSAPPSLPPAPRRRRLARIGCPGLSFGGEMLILSAVSDPQPRATVAEGASKGSIYEHSSSAAS
jgi:hypothetical protein